MNKYITFFITTLLFFSFQSIIFGKEQAASKKEKLTEYLSSLVTFKTLSSDHESNFQALQWVEKQLQPLKLKFRFQTFEGYNALLITTLDTKKPKVWLLAHMDVVPGSDSLFHAEIKDH